MALFRVETPLRRVFQQAASDTQECWRLMCIRTRAVVAGMAVGHTSWLVYKDRESVAWPCATHISDPAHHWTWIVEFVPVSHGFSLLLAEAMELVRLRLALVVSCVRGQPGTRGVQ